MGGEAAARREEELGSELTAQKGSRAGHSEEELGLDASPPH